jgi:hypothetical protein
MVSLTYAEFSALQADTRKEIRDTVTESQKGLLALLEKTMDAHTLAPAPAVGESLTDLVAAIGGLNTNSAPATPAPTNTLSLYSDQIMKMVGKTP